MEQTPKRPKPKMDVFYRADEPNHLAVYIGGRAIEFDRSGGTMTQVGYTHNLPPWQLNEARILAEKTFRERGGVPEGADGS